MKLPAPSDTIVALATPPGEGGLAVIRVSGTEAVSIAAKGFQGKRSLASAPTHTAHFGHFVNQNTEILDEVVAVVFRGPKSYTGEDTVELSCHGGTLVSRRITEAILALGARLAEPGEFTKRAFLNGKLDLSQAEAIADLIHAKSDTAHRSSLAQLNGKLSQRVQNMRNQLIQAISRLELELDFAEEGYQFADKSEVKQQLDTIIGEIDDLSKTYHEGRSYREGTKVVIIGPPNAGKSSLLNAILSDNRAIVADIPGTTRDVIEEQISIQGMFFRVVDTAGLRESTDFVEQEGMRRTKEQAETGEVVLVVIDASKDLLETEKKAIVELLSRKELKGAQKVAIMNKTDLVKGRNGHIKKAAKFLGDLPVVELSAKTGTGLVDLKEMLLRITRTTVGSEGVMITNQRHFRALHETKKALEMASSSTKKNASGEFIAVDLRRALDNLGEITGEVTTDEILNNIFSKFCIGK